MTYEPEPLLMLGQGEYAAKTWVCGYCQSLTTTHGPQPRECPACAARVMSDVGRYVCQCGSVHTVREDVPYVCRDCGEPRYGWCKKGNPPGRNDCACERAVDHDGLCAVHDRESYLPDVPNE